MELKVGFVPLRVTGWFFVMAALLGSNERNPVLLGIWIAVVLVSVVIHELGHAVVGKAFGLVPRIDLHGMGGTTSFSRQEGAPDEPLGAAKSAAISLAGPFAGFLFAAVVIAADAAGIVPRHPLAIHAVSTLKWVNIAWGIFNLVPMLPLDGGNVMRSILGAITKDKAELIARVVSIVFAGAIGLYAVTTGAWWSLYLALVFVFSNVQALRQVGQRRVDAELALALEQAHQALTRDDPNQAVHLLGPALAPNASTDLRQAGLRVYLVSMIRAGMSSEAMPIIEKERLTIGQEDLARYAVAMRDLGRVEDAERIERLVQLEPLAAFRA